jgi:bile acid:Na+ symporter, BASS family
MSLGKTSMLMELVSKASTVAMLSFVVSSMLAMGSGLTVSQISEPLRNTRLVLLALVANFVVMPLGALALAKMLSLDEPFGVGLLLLGCAAGAPFLPKLAELARGNLAFAVGAMVLLMVTTVVYLPIILPLLLPGVTVNAWVIARSLILLMLLPLAMRSPPSQDRSYACSQRSAGIHRCRSTTRSAASPSFMCQ